jgi:hypothetical protein
MLLKKYNKTIISFIIIYFFVLVCHGLAAGNRRLINDVFSNLTDSRQSSTYQLFGIVGQSSPVGKSQNNMYTCLGGFHYGEIHVDPPFCIVDVKEFQYQLTVTAIVTEPDKDHIDHKSDLLGAFVDDQCRGFATLETTPYGNIFFLQVWSNAKNGEILHFKYYDPHSRRKINIKETIEFSPDGSFGTIKSPHVFTLSDIREHVMTIAPLSQNISAEGGNMSFTVVNKNQTGISWTATSQSNWLSISNENSGSGNGFISVYCEANTEYEYRTGYLLVSSSDSSYTPITLTVIQQQKAYDNAIISIQSEKINFRKNTHFSTDIFVENVNDLGGFDFEIQFDPTVICAQNIELGDFIKRTSRQTLPLGNNIDCEKGILHFAVITLGNELPGASGKGVLATIYWQTLNQDKPSEISFSKVQLTTTDADIIPSSTQNNYISVCPLIKLTPKNQKINSYDSFTTQMMIEDAKDLGSYEFEIRFSPTDLCAESIEMGEFLSNTGRSSITVTNEIDCSEGIINYAVGSTGRDIKGPDGNGVLAIIHWNVTKRINPEEGSELTQEISSIIQIDKAQVTYTDSHPVVPELESAMVELSLCHANDFDCDCDIDIVDVQKVANTYSCECGMDCYVPAYDNDLDCDIDIVDVMKVANNYGWDCDEMGEETGTQTFRSKRNRSRQNMILQSNNERTVRQTNETIQTHILIYDVSDLGGFEFEISYNSETLEAHPDIQLGDFLESSGRSAFQMRDDDQNTIKFSAASFGNSPGATGDGILAEITWRIKSDGPYEFDLKNIQLTDTTPNTNIITPFNVRLVEICNNNEDMDYDQLPDDWEMENFGDLTQNPSTDYDGDGETNLDEFNWNTNPANALSTNAVSNKYTGFSYFAIPELDDSGAPISWHMNITCTAKPGETFISGELSANDGSTLPLDIANNGKQAIYTNSDYASLDEIINDFSSEMYTMKLFISSPVKDYQLMIQSEIKPFNLDINGDLKNDALSDGLYIIRYLFGLTDHSTQILYTGKRRTDASINAYIKAGIEYLDIDCNGESDALTDGLLILRYLFSITEGESLLNNSVDYINGQCTSELEIQSNILKLFMSDLL